MRSDASGPIRPCSARGCLCYIIIHYDDAIQHANTAVGNILSYPLLSRLLSGDRNRTQIPPFKPIPTWLNILSQVDAGLQGICNDLLEFHIHACIEVSILTQDAVSSVAGLTQCAMKAPVCVKYMYICVTLWEAVSGHPNAENTCREAALCIRSLYVCIII